MSNVAKSASLPPHAPCRLQRDFIHLHTYRCSLPPHAPCRLQRIRGQRFQMRRFFASTRPVQIATRRSRHTQSSFILCLHTPRADCNAYYPCNMGVATIFASTRPVQIATRLQKSARSTRPLPPHAPCRLQLQKCTELQYALFRTCVELVDSFSVLNKSMLR